MTALASGIEMQMAATTMDEFLNRRSFPANSIIQSWMGRSLSSPPAWFERKFDFTFPLEVYPNVMTRLRGTPIRLEETIGSQLRDALVHKPGGKWSAQEHAGHMADMEALWLERVQDYVCASSELTVADLSNRKTEEAKHNTREPEQILAEFRTARHRLVKQIEEFSPELFGRVIPHPRLKTPMRLIDHLYFVAEHDDHHLTRIWELLMVKRGSD